MNESWLGRSAIQAAAIGILAALAVACSGAPPAASPEAATAVPSSASSPPAAVAAQVAEPAQAEPTPKPLPTSVPEATPTPSENRPPPSGATGLKEGQTAPDFDLATFDGRTVKLSDYRGKVVVLNFWASWCPPCRWEMPHFEEIWQEYGQDEVVFLGVAISDYEEDARAFSDKTGVTYPVGLDRTGEIARAYRPTSMPTTFFIDRDGLIARKLASVANQAILRLFIQGQLREG